MEAAIIAVSISSLVVIGTLVGLAWYQARELKDCRSDLAAFYVSNNEVVKANFDLQIRNRTLDAENREVSQVVVGLRDQLQLETAARRFAEEGMKRLLTDLANKADTGILQAVLVRDLKKLEDLRRPPGPPQPAPPVGRKTPPETPAAKEAKTVPFDPAFLPPLPPVKKP